MVIWGIVYYGFTHVVYISISKYIWRIQITKQQSYNNLNIKQYRWDVFLLDLPNDISIYVYL